MIKRSGGLSRLLPAALALAMLAGGHAALAGSGGAGAGQAGGDAAADAFFAGQTPQQVMATTLIGFTVVGSDDRAVGAVTDLIIGPDGRVDGVVIGVGGFLGVGEKKVAAPFSRLGIVRNGEGKIDRIRLDMSRDDLEKAPSFVTLAERRAKEKPARAGREGEGR
ncbi:PRC-barrel domain-containing protein [Camelimonas abortus]|uniref:PRC-barrel domain-containing protein n=1 Tax=Camelimonas abortus TaxID=1017184 RepID=A0ABV7LHW5_9HYPH